MRGGQVFEDISGGTRTLGDAHLRPSKSGYRMTSATGSTRDFLAFPPIKPASEQAAPTIRIRVSLSIQPSGGNLAQIVAPHRWGLQYATGMTRIKRQL